MNRFVLVVLLFVTSFASGQNTNSYNTVDSKMEAIPKENTSSTASIVQYITDNFQSEEDKIRAAFYWCAANISYDVESMYNQQPNQLTDDRIRKTLSTHKGVCADYVAVFNDIANKLGIKTHEVAGYTKQKGKVVLLSHVWSVSKIGGKWYLIDPTWGAGYVNEMQFIRHLENNYFKSNPSEFILNHIPYDYSWQLLEHPISNQDFYDNKSQPNDLTVSVDYDSLINNLDQISNEEAMKASAQRVEKGGLKNKLIVDYLNMLNTNMDAAVKNANVKRLMGISNDFSVATQQYNAYIAFRNHKFEPEVSDDELKSMIETPRNTVKRCLKEIDGITNLSRENIKNNKAFIDNMHEFEKLTDIQFQFVEDYLKKNKVGRKLSFVIPKKH